jgi:hypothetical protein
VPRREPQIKAIPTLYNGVAMRSRLEARWASMFDALRWHWEYEPDLQAGFVIPDFLLPNFAHPIVLECKPAVTIEEIVEYRRILICKMHEWLSTDVLREIRLLDADSDTPVELTDQALDDLVRVHFGNNPRGRTRRIFVVGPCLHLVDDVVTIDGEHGFCICCAHGEPTHIGLTTELAEPCLLCGQEATAWVAPHTMLTAWRESQNIVQWKPRC